MPGFFGAGALGHREVRSGRESGCWAGLGLL